ncbi:response regulator transcription factor [Denitrobaculum tricleocarpae]|uniref:Response regulator n=1 Tax=Denitrobaculum tricleocarpae TaxID=2591009 RepID=A0A545TF90_9PROT|nr:response regulator [Denitrobaculum tricleocarpae]TQV75897.1 response regulator [Denitrobaculum tricleocarpae]
MNSCGYERNSAVVVVVDDDDAVRDSLRILLETDDISVLTYASGEEFLASHPHARCDCVMLDIHLPGVSGISVLRQLTAAGFDDPVILMTGRPSEAVRVEAERAGALALLLKPLDGDKIFDILDRGIAARRAEQKPEPDRFH